MAQSKDDWVKMRTSLFNHPKVLGMVIDMAPNGGLLDRNGNVTKDALRLVTIGGLCVTWGQIRHRGIPQENGDCVLKGATLDMIDMMVGIDGFGMTMVRAGYIEDTGEDLVFPGFFDNFNRVPPKPGRQRTKECRERKKAGVTKTALHVTEKSTEKEKEIKKELPTVVPKKKPPKAKPERNIIPPTLDMVTAYCAERNNGIEPQAFIDHYEANGWQRGKTRIRDWQATIRTWEQQRKNNGSGQQASLSGGDRPKTARQHNADVHDYLAAELRKELDGSET
jgi:hypothetical protein